MSLKKVLHLKIRRDFRLHNYQNPTTYNKIPSAKHYISRKIRIIVIKGLIDTFDMNKKRRTLIEKDSPKRSIAKAISWRIVATLTTFLISFVVFKKYTGKSLKESLQSAGLIVFVEFFIKILIYYLHERFWTNIQWGKYWRKTFIAKRMWKKLYRKMHEKHHHNA